MKLVALVTVLFLASCSKHYPAPVAEAKYKNTYSTLAQSYKPKFDPKYTTVDKGDTLYSIGFSHNMDYKYLAKINNIPAPYKIYPGQRLRLKASKLSIANNAVKTTPIKIKKPIKPAVKVSQTNKVEVKPVAKPIVKVKPITKPHAKIVVKPQTKPVVKPIVRPIARTPNSNSRWIWPVSGKVISTFSTTDMARKGIDIASPIGKPVYASNNGTVVYSGDGLLGYGELIILKHDNNLLSAYANNSSRLVKEGVAVKQGQQIAKSGKGSDGRGLLHFEIRKNGQPVNPLKYLPKN